MPQNRQLREGKHLKEHHCGNFISRFLDQIVFHDRLTIVIKPAPAAVLPAICTPGVTAKTRVLIHQHCTFVTACTIPAAWPCGWLVRC